MTKDNPLKKQLLQSISRDQYHSNDSGAFLMQAFVSLSPYLLALTMQFYHSVLGPACKVGVFRYSDISRSF